MPGFGLPDGGEGGGGWFVVVPAAVCGVAVVGECVGCVVVWVGLADGVAEAVDSVVLEPKADVGRGVRTLRAPDDPGLDRNRSRPLRAAARSACGRAWTEPGTATAAGRLRGGRPKEWPFLISFPQVRELRNSIHGLDQSGRLTATADGYAGRHP